MSIALKINSWGALTLTKLSVFSFRSTGLLGLGFALTVSGCVANAQPNISTRTEPRGQAKNVILFIGDGMGVSTVTAARIFDGQAQGLKGEEHSLAFEDFDNLALVKTYNANSQVPDSAGTATAIMSGYKADIGTINVEPGQRQQGCGTKPVRPTLAQRSMAAGKAVGIISTARITHATPAAMYGHVDNRDWESHDELPDHYRRAGCQALAAQLVASPVNLVLGGGRKEFSRRQIAELKKKHHYVTSRAELLAASGGRSIRGLFSDSHMDFETDRDASEQPSLAEMTAFAIKQLAADEDGYVLMIEAGRVDHAHHGTNAYRALTDMQALNEAVKIAKATTGDDTLILVTADHSHVFTIAGYAVRGNPILGLVREADRENGGAENGYATAEDGKPYTTLGYHNGEKLRDPEGPALTQAIVQAKDYEQEVAVAMGSETHGGEDVPLYARGPGADKVRGVMEQDEIGRLIVDVLGLK